MPQPDLDRALADIAAIRGQLAAGAAFQGFGPLVVAATGGIALATMLLQSMSPELAASPLGYVAIWVVAAVLASVLVGAEMVARSRRRHGGLADAMLFQAIEQFLPAAFAGAAITLVILKFAPQAGWILPGLWQVLFATGLFASLRTLPRTIAIVAAWYFLSGITVMIIASQGGGLLSAYMGVPFAVGQLGMAVILHLAERPHDKQ